MSAHLPPPASVSSPEALPAAHAVIRPRWRRPAVFAASLAGLAGAWTLGVGVWLPHALQPRLLAAAEEALGVPVQIQALAVSPWRLTVRLSGVQLGAADAPVLRIGAVEGQVSLASLWHRAPVLRRLDIDAPELLLTRHDEGRLNISPILARLQARAADAPASDAPARFAVFNIALDGGLIRYEDRVLGQTHTVDRLRVGVPFVSSLPSQIDVAVQPLLEARVNGSALRLAGTTLPFQAGHRSEIKVAWRDVDLAAWLPHARPWLPAEWAAVADAGRLSTDLTLSFAQPADAAAPELAIRGQVVLTDLALRLPRAPGVGQVQLGWRSLTLGGLDLQPLVQRANVGRVALDGLTLTTRALATRAATARPVSAASTARSKAPPAASPTTLPAGPPAALADGPQGWQWAVGELVASASHIDAQTERAAPWPVVRAVQLDVKRLSSDAGAAPARWQLALQDDGGGRAQAQGEWQLSQGRGHASLRLDDGALVPWWRPLAGRLALPFAPTAGSLSLQARVSVQRGSAWQVQLSDTALQVSGFAVKAASGSDRLAWRKLTAEGVRFDTTATGQPGAASVASVALDGLDVDWTHAPAAPVAGAGEAATPARDGPKWSVGRLACTDCQFSVRDASTVPAARVELTQLQLSIEGASHDAAHPLKVALDTRAQGPGRVRFDGEVRRAPLAVQGQVEVQSLDLRVLQAYLAPHLNAQLASAQAQAAGRLMLGMGAQPDSLSVRYRGRLGLDRVQLLDKVNEAEFLRWRRLALEGTDLSWRQGQVQADLGRIALQDAYGRIILQPDGRLNLASIVRQAGDGDATPTSITTPQVAAAPAVTAPAPAGAIPPTASAASEVPPPMDLRWRGIQLRNAQVDFTDTFIRPSYSARLTRLSGSVSGVAARQPEPAELMLTGAVDDGAPLSIKGTLHPLGPKLFTDIEGEARGVELTRMSPYAARHAGYAIERGTLSVNVRYKVEDGRLAATNRLFLDQLTFGEPSGDPQATRLPVRLAVALLKNSRGEIDINLPISGSLDDPQFSVGGILWRVVANLVTKAVTAPFALLMGGDSDEAGEVPFAAGEATLSDAARQRLDAMGARLADRPELKLDAIGHAHAAVDADGLREAHAMRLMRVAKSRALGVPLDEAVISADERDRWLAAAYRAADIRKPRNVVGVPKSLPPGEQLALLKAAAPVDAAALRALADQRADAVKAYLIERLPAERVRLGASVVQAEAQPLPATPPPGVRFAVR